MVPICLPFEDAEDEDYIQSGGRSAPLTHVAGWGATTVTGRKPANITQWLPVDVQDDAACRGVYKERGAVLTEGQQMCAGGEVRQR